MDTNHLIPLLREGHEHRPAILQRLAAVPPQSPVYIATATVAELEVGCCFQQKGRLESQAEIRKVIRANGLRILKFTSHTAAEYGVLKAALMRRYGREGLKKAAKWPEVWTSPVKGQPLGVDEMDLLVISHAIERNLVLVTSDKMKRIREALSEPYPGFRIENWAKRTVLSP